MPPPDDHQVCTWAVLLWVFQFFRFVWASWRREGYWIPPKTCNSGRLHNLRRTVGVWENTDSWLGAQIGSVLKPIQTLKEYFWSHVYCAHLGIPWYQIVGASRTVSNRESRYPHQNRPTDEHGTIICIWMTLQYFSSLYVQLLMIYCDITAVLLDLRFRSFSHFLFVRVDLNPLKK